MRYDRQNLKEGEFLLTYSQIFELNKLMPKGMKIELSENTANFEASLKHPQIKRPRSSNIIRDYSEDEEESRVWKKKKSKKYDEDYQSRDDSSSSKQMSSLNSKRLREKKSNIMVTDSLPFKKEIVKKPKLSQKKEINKKCERLLNKLKNHPLCDYFNKLSTEPSLSGVERRLKNLEYSSYHQFGMDVRKVWNMHFLQSVANSDAYLKTFTLSNYFEDLFKDVEKGIVQGNDNVRSLPKKVNNLQEKINTNKNVVSQTSNNVKREIPQTFSDKPLTSGEKNQIGCNIKLLTIEQLRGIIKILANSVPVDSSNQYFEFDIETLPPSKLRELDRYVKDCLKESNRFNYVGRTPNAFPKYAPRKTSNLVSNKTDQNVEDNIHKNTNNTSPKRPMKRSYEEDLRKSEPEPSLQVHPC